MAEIEKQKGVLSYRINGVLYNKSFSLEEKSHIPHGHISIDQKETPAGILFHISLEPDKKAVFEMERFEVLFSLKGLIKKCFINGFQSWSESCERSPWSTQKQMNPLFSYWINKYQLKKYSDQHFTTYPGKPGEFISYSYGYIRHKDDTITLAGTLNEKNGYTIIKIQTNPDGDNTDITVLKECEGQRLLLHSPTVILSFFLGTGREAEVFNSWGSSFTGLQKLQKPVSGWTSWYNNFEKINEQIILKNLKSFTDRGIPIDVFQIDDGWQSTVGDWLKINEKFPNGLTQIAREIRKAGYTPGLWLAPFAAEESSALCRDHADWILRDDRGPVRAGYNPFSWKGKFYGLNIDHPEVKGYLRMVFYTILETWGFGMVKLDFLYAAALTPRDGKSRGQIMYEGMEFLREVTAKKLMLACGVPLGSAFGKTDYCRIGSDVALTWEDKRLKLFRYNERVSTINSLTSTIGRQHLNKRFFLNDPDVFILRDENNKLSTAGKDVLFFVNNLFGALVFTSDDISTYSEKQLQQYYSSFPIMEKNILSVSTDKGLYTVDFQIGKHFYAAYINVSGESRKITLKGDTGSGWYSEQTGIKTGGWQIKLKGYDTLCLTKVPVRPWSVIGTTGRLFPASEIYQVFNEDNEMTITFREGTLLAGDVIVRLPKGTEICMINNNSALIEVRYGITTGRASLI